MACEITVKLKNPMKSLTRVSPLIEKHCFTSLEDPVVKGFVDSVVEEFNDIVQKRSITIKLIEE